MIKICCNCGDRYDAKGEWQTYCLNCFKEIKKKETQRLKDEIEYLTAKVNALSNLRPSSFNEMFLKQLIILCHPDRHENSKLSNDVTSKLIEMRKNAKR